MSESPSIFSQLNDWYERPLAQSLSKAIMERLEPILSHLFGYHLLLLGLPVYSKYLISSPISHKTCVVPDKSLPPVLGMDNVVTAFETLPFNTSSIDVLILPHTLAFTKDPWVVLSEVERVLMPEGHVVIIGFNPWSFWGIRRFMPPFPRQVPWCGKFISSVKLRHHLTMTNFAVTHFQNFFFRPPVNNPHCFEQLLFLETLGRLTWPYPAGVYLMVAKKQIARMSQIKPIWSFRNLVIGKNMPVSDKF